MPELLTYDVAQVAELTGLGRTTIFEMLADGTGPRSLKVGRRRLVLRSDLLTWLEERAEQTEREEFGS